MYFIIVLNVIGVFVVTIALWYKFFRYLFPKVKVSSPEAIGRAVGFLVITEVGFSALVSVVISAIRKTVEVQFLIETLYLFKLFGFLIIAVVGSFIATKTLEDTRTMNVKIFAAVCFVPNLFISSLSYSSGIEFAASTLGVPLISIIGGYFLIKKYPQFYNN